MDARYDAVVVGGGAAGLSGAVTLARARRSVVVIDAGRPRNAPADGVHGFLGHDGVAPAALRDAGRAELARYGGEQLTGAAVSARSTAAGIEVVLSDGRRVVARRLLVTTGLTDELPDVVGLADRWGRDVLHCPYCHGWEVRDRLIGVLGTGPLAVHQALLFRQWTDRVTLFLHTAPEPSDEQWEQLAAREVAVVDGQVAALEVIDDRLSGLRLRTGRVVPAQALVVGVPAVARSGVLDGLGLAAVDERVDGLLVGRSVPTGPAGATTAAGVWAAGNVADIRAGVVGCAAAGTAAAAAMNADLVAEDTRAAVVARRAVVPVRRPAEPFSGRSERELCTQVLGDRRHGC